MSLCLREYIASTLTITATHPLSIHWAGVLSWRHLISIVYLLIWMILSFFVLDSKIDAMAINETKIDRSVNDNEIILLARI